jgi:Fe-S-cluster-containing dehydrogenase component
MKKWNLVIDVAECHNCNNCFLSVKDEYVGNDIPGYCAPQPPHGHKWINILARERGRAPMVDAAYVPTTCNHCDAAPCIEAGRGAVKKRKDGIVLIDPEAAKGRRDLLAACPYGAIWWNEERSLPQAWPFDAHLLDRGWSTPRPAQSCPTGAFQALKISDAEMAQKASVEGLQTLRPELGTKPRVYYRNLHRYTKLFAGGTVLAAAGGIIDCLAGARVALVRDGLVIAAVDTDAFGDFKFDRLEPESGVYEIRVTHGDHRLVPVSFEMHRESVVLQDIVLDLR